MGSRFWFEREKLREVASRRRRELEHQVVGERALGRRDDHRLVNLWVMSSRADVVHHSLLDR